MKCKIPPSLDSLFALTAAKLIESQGLSFSYQDLTHSLFYTLGGK